MHRKAPRLGVHGQMAIMTALALAGPEHLPALARAVNGAAGPDLTDDDRMFLAQLSSVGLTIWCRRYRRGLKAEEKRFVAERVKEIKAAQAEA